MRLSRVCCQLSHSAGAMSHCSPASTTQSPLSSALQAGSRPQAGAPAPPGLFCALGGVGEFDPGSCTCSHAFCPGLHPSPSPTCFSAPPAQAALLGLSASLVPGNLVPHWFRLPGAGGPQGVGSVPQLGEGGISVDRVQPCTGCKELRGGEHGFHEAYQAHSLWTE